MENLELLQIQPLKRSSHLPETGTASHIHDVLRPELREARERMAAQSFFESYLQANITASDILQRHHQFIDEFRSHAPRKTTVECCDGRVFGRKRAGYPPGVVSSVHTDGANIDVSPSNKDLRTRINDSVIDARRNTPGMPALFIAGGHRSDHEGMGCAAHHCNDDHALHAILKQSHELRQSYKKQNINSDSLYILGGMTNTDDMTETLHFPDGNILSTAQIIEDLGLTEPSEVFSSSFLSRPLDDEAIQQATKGLPAGELLHGNEALMYRDLEIGIAMEVYLMREISAFCNHSEAEAGGANTTIHPDVYRMVQSKLDAVMGLPKGLRGPLLYQILWNIAYGVYQRKFVASMEEDQRRQYLDHGEDLVCYGNGFRTLPRNSCIHVTPGRGNDAHALTVAKKVLLKNRSHRPQLHKPLAHINIEVPGAVNSCEEFRQVESTAMTMKEILSEVFEDEVHLLTTYSHKNQMRFYPIRLHESDTRECLGAGITDSMRQQDFHEHGLNVKETQYTFAMRARMMTSRDP